MSGTLPCGRKRPSFRVKTAVSQKAREIPIWKVQLDEYLKKKGLRSTSQREKVAEVALSKKTHFEIQNLIRDIQQKYSEISPATVYRSVATLCDAGIIHESFESESGVTLYEAQDDEHHDHIVCLDCGEIFEFHDEGLEKAQNQALNKLQFEPERHRHVIYARCQMK
jgi:Fur family ferric uptake transcriptional regulator